MDWQGYKYQCISIAFLLFSSLITNNTLRSKITKYFKIISSSPLFQSLLCLCFATHNNLLNKYRFCNQTACARQGILLTHVYKPHYYWKLYFSFNFSGFLQIFKNKYNLSWEYLWLAFVFFAVDLNVCETYGFTYVWFQFKYDYTNLFCFNIP